MLLTLLTYFYVTISFFNVPLPYALPGSSFIINLTTCVFREAVSVHYWKHYCLKSTNSVWVFRAIDNKSRTLCNMIAMKTMNCISEWVVVEAAPKAIPSAEIIQLNRGESNIIFR